MGETLICCYGFNLVSWIYDLITNPIMGYCIGFIASVYLIYFQFKKSSAGFRLQSVISSTQDIVDKLQDENDAYVGLLRNKYRFSLGVVIDLLATTFGTKNIIKIKSHFPALVNIDGGRWEIFLIYVRPVIQDINSYSFLGWLPFSKKMKQLKALVALCNAIEAVVAELDAVAQIDVNNSTTILKAEDVGLTINLVGNEKYESEIKLLYAKYEILETAWRNWLKLVNR